MSFINMKEKLAVISLQLAVKTKSMFLLQLRGFQALWFLTDNCRLQTANFSYSSSISASIDRYT